MANTIMVKIGKGIEMECPLPSAVSPEVRDHVWYIGLRNILMDSHAGVTLEKCDGDESKVVPESRAVAEKKLAALIAGDLRTTSTREVDPVRREAVKLAFDHFTNKARAKIKSGDWAGKKIGDKDVQKAVRTKATENIEAFMAQAKKNVDAAKKLNVDIDL